MNQNYIESKVHELSKRKIQAISSGKVTVEDQQSQQCSHSTNAVVFTDLDGSLLDHYTYDYEPALPLLSQLKTLGIPVVFVSSKTRVEIEKFRSKLTTAQPFISENGAAVFVPLNYFSKQPANTIERDGYWVKEFGVPRESLRAFIEWLGHPFSDDVLTFSQMGTEGIAALAELPLEAAALANSREYTEPFTWLGLDENRQSCFDAIISAGANVQQGGRFYHLSGNGDKGTALTWLLSMYQQECMQDSFVSIAIGDSDNDVAMLETADHAVIVRSPVHKPPKLRHQSQFIVTDETGPLGWQQGVRDTITLIYGNKNTPSNQQNKGPNNNE